ncbi:hypothetical protein DFJ63DRAFT_161940 [Scheffersomyces coipomensis]|uniref:uncharacterized protein n=1 Tax=Scheffersomyces coipomensis TaxID=1788519 RepID=UPI00315CCF2D
MHITLVKIYLVLASLFACAIAGLTNSEMLDLAKTSSKNIITINDKNYEDLLYGVRDFHLVILMTSESTQINCVLCREFRPDFELIAKSWYQDHPYGLNEVELDEEYEESGIAKKNVYFGRSEYTESRNLFQIFSLASIPKVFHFAPTEDTGVHNLVAQSSEYQFFQGEQLDLVRNFLNQKTGHQYNIHVPVNYTVIGLNVALTIIGLFIIYKFNAQIVKFLSSPTLWMLVSSALILMFISGYMFNQIRQTPYLREQNGQTQYFSQGQQTQFGIETQIVAFIYGFMSILVIVLIKRVPDISNSFVNFIAVSIISILIFVFYSLFLSVFGSKGLGYPYQFMKLF